MCRFIEVLVQDAGLFEHDKMLDVLFEDAAYPARICLMASVENSVVGRSACDSSQDSTATYNNITGRQSIVDHQVLIIYSLRARSQFE